MNPNQFLKIGGAVLVALGVLGFFLIGPTESQSVFGAGWWFDPVENWTHLVLGVVAIAAAYVLGSGAQKGLVLLVGIIGVVVGLYSIFVSESLGGANLERVADSVLHLVVGAWALLAATKKQSSMMMPGM